MRAWWVLVLVLGVSGCASSNCDRSIADRELRERGATVLWCVR